MIENARGCLLFDSKRDSFECRFVFRLRRCYVYDSISKGNNGHGVFFVAFFYGVVCFYCVYLMCVCA